MPAKTISVKSASKSNSWILHSAVIFAVIANLCLSVNAIRCHQCNSRTEADCNELRLNTPNSPIDDQFLRECEGDEPSTAFCRKTVFKIDITGEYRVIRACGWMNDQRGRNDTCFEADNEGFKQMICSCFEDGCNSAPAARNFNYPLAVGLMALSILLGSKILRRSF